MDYKNMNDNILSKQWKERYNEQPQSVKEKLDELDNAQIAEYQLKVIKRKRIYPQVGDIFKLNPRENIFFNGVVLNNHINNINGDDLILILIFREGINIKKRISNKVREDELLLPPQIVGKEYWTRGYFYNIDHYDEKIKIDNYGFYSIGKGKFFNEYGEEIVEKPQLLGTFGVSTVYGIAMEINQELIILGIM